MEKHGVVGWYIGPALENYRCYKVFVLETIPDRIADVVFFSQNVIIPRVSSADAATIAVQD